IVGTVLFLLLALAVPIGIALSASVAAFVLGDPLLEMNTIFRSFFSFIGKYSLMAIPLFIFAGFLMERTGLVSQLFRFADSLAGWMPGGFGVATVIACVLFGAISGSSVAMAAAMSVIAIPEMRKRGYPDWLSGGLVATAGGIAMLIPPSIILLVFGVITETSIVELFFAGVIPGLLLATGNALSVILISLYLGLPRGTFSLPRVWTEFKGAAPALGMPIVILGGLYGGLFTPTEAAAAACGYALLYGVLSGGRKFINEMLPTATRALNLTAVIVFLIGSVGVFQFLAANMYWPQKIAQTIVDMGLTPLGFIFAYMGVLIFLGMLVDGVAMVLLTVPVVFPIAMALKIDPLHLAVMITLNVEMGVVTPPVGLNLFAVSGTSKIPLQQVLKGTIPFFLGDLTVLLLVIFFPALATWLPSVLVTKVF
ncbi:MAG TPA: TRAP transporter large permease, partial [Burkholderiales bacterium]|nr:TRAP transporter large permease [Burkholderiales bacterium]